MKVVICRVVFHTPAEAQAQKALQYGAHLLSVAESGCAAVLALCLLLLLV